MEAGRPRVTGRLDLFDDVLEQICETAMRQRNRRILVLGLDRAPVRMEAHVERRTSRVRASCSTPYFHPIGATPTLVASKRPSPGLPKPPIPNNNPHLPVYALGEFDLATDGEI